MQKGDTVICIIENEDKEPIDLGMSGIVLSGNKVLIPGKEYIIEGFDLQHITKGDGPESIRYWTKVMLKGVKEPQWLRFFKLKEK